MNNNCLNTLIEKYKCMFLFPLDKKIWSLYTINCFKEMAVVFADRRILYIYTSFWFLKSLIAFWGVSFEKKKKKT